MRPAWRKARRRVPDAWVWRGGRRGLEGSWPDKGMGRDDEVAEEIQQLPAHASNLTRTAWRRVGSCQRDWTFPAGLYMCVRGIMPAVRAGRCPGQDTVRARYKLLVHRDLGAVALRSIVGVCCPAENPHSVAVSSGNGPVVVVYALDMTGQARHRPNTRRR